MISPRDLSNGPIRRRGNDPRDLRHKPAEEVKENDDPSTRPPQRSSQDVRGYPTAPVVRHGTGLYSRAAPVTAAAGTAGGFGGDSTASPTSGGAYQHQPPPLPGDLSSLVPYQVNPSSFPPSSLPSTARHFIWKVHGLDELKYTLLHSRFGTSKKATPPTTKARTPVMAEMQLAYQAATATPPTQPLHSALASPVFLYFTVQYSGEFAGVATMASPVEPTGGFDDWTDSAALRWLFVWTLPRHSVQSMRFVVPAKQESKSIAAARQGFELDDPAQGRKLLSMWADTARKTHSGPHPSHTGHRRESSDPREQQPVDRAGASNASPGNRRPSAASSASSPHPVSVPDHSQRRMTRSQAAAAAASAAPQGTQAGPSTATTGPSSAASSSASASPLASPSSSGPSLTDKVQWKGDEGGEGGRGRGGRGRSTTRGRGGRGSSARGSPSPQKPAHDAAPSSAHDKERPTPTASSPASTSTAPPTDAVASTSTPAKDSTAAHEGPDVESEDVSDAGRGRGRGGRGGRGRGGRGRGRGQQKGASVFDLNLPLSSPTSTAAVNGPSAGSPTSASPSPPPVNGTGAGASTPSSRGRGGGGGRGVRGTGQKFVPKVAREDGGAGAGGASAPAAAAASPLAASSPVAAAPAGKAE